MLALAQWGQTAQLLLGIGVLVTTLIGMTGFLLLPALRLCLGGGGGVVGWVTVGFLCVVVCVLINSSCWPMRELLLGLCPPATYATTGPNAEGRSVRETLVRSGILALARLVETVQTFVGLVLMLAMLCGVAVPLILLIRLARAGGLTPGGLAVAAILLILGLLLVRACCSSVRELLRLLRAVGREPTPGKGADDLTARCGVLRASAEERLTLTPRALRHEPGLYLDGRNLHCGLPQEVPRSEIGAIRLEWNDTRPRPTFEPSQRLLVEQGGGQFEIGPNLRDPEREWLADVLRAWAAVPIPAGPADQGEDGGEAVAAGRGG